MKTEAKTISYNGTLFRNKTEARWAAFFDLCGFKWQYRNRQFAEWTPAFTLTGETGEIYVEASAYGEGDDLFPTYEVMKGHREWLGEIKTPGSKLYLFGELSEMDEADCLTSGWIEEAGGPDGEKTYFDPMCWSYDPDGNIDFHPFYGSWKLRMSGVYEGDAWSFGSGKHNRAKILELWDRAGAVVATVATWKREPIPPSIRFQVFARSKSRCVTCGTDSSRARLEVDHIIPVSRGGTNDLANLQALCVTCNQGKGAYLARE